MAETLASINARRSALTLERRHLTYLRSLVPDSSKKIYNEKRVDVNGQRQDVTMQRNALMTQQYIDRGETDIPDFTSAKYCHVHYAFEKGSTKSRTKRIINGKVISDKTETSSCSKRVK